MALFQWGQFRSHSGALLPFKIECDALTEEDWAALAQILVGRIPLFGSVEGVPRGGIQLAHALEPFCQPGYLPLIVDDVYSTGDSMDRQRNGRQALGAVVFARAPVTQRWIYALFVLQEGRPKREDW